MRGSPPPRRVNPAAARPATCRHSSCHVRSGADLVPARPARNALVTALLVLLALSGCSATRPAASIPAEAPLVVFADSRRSNDPAFSKRERTIIAAARRHLEESGKRSVDAYYQIEHTADGFEVFVLYVCGYTGSQPLFKPGGHCTVLLREDGSVIRVIGGA